MKAPAFLLPLFRRWRKHTKHNKFSTPLTTEDDTAGLEEKVKRLERELAETRQNASKSNAECQKLRNFQKSLDDEVQDLTETLFQVCNVLLLLR